MCTNPAQGQKKQKQKIPIYLRRGDYPSRVFCFFCPSAGLVHFGVQDFCFFCPCAGLVHFEVQNFVCFVPVQVWCTLKFKPQCICSCFLLFLLLADILDTYGIFCFPCSFLKGQVHFSCKGFTIWRKNWSFSEPDSGFRKLEFFLLKCQYT